METMQNQIALVTGAAGNLGQAVGAALLDAGVRVALLDRDADRVRALFPTVAEDRLLMLGADLTRAEEVAAAVEEVRGRFGRIDLLANIAGGFRMGSAVHETEDEDWEFLFGLNLRPVLYTARAVVPGMLEQGGGCIVNVGARVEPARAKMGAYAASKSALMRVTESMALELRASGIRVNGIVPGTIDTPQNRDAMPDADYSHWVAPADLAQVVLFLCSDAARAVNGAMVPVVGLS